MTSTGEPDRAAEFDGWVAMQEGLMDEFETCVVPELPRKKYSREGLQAAERSLLNRFASPSDTRSSRERFEEFEQYARFLGETFIRVFGGVWGVDQNRGVMPVVAFPGDDDLPISPFGLATAAVARRTGNEWARVFDFKANAG